MHTAWSRDSHTFPVLQICAAVFLPSHCCRNCLVDELRQKMALTLAFFVLFVASGRFVVTNRKANVQIFHA